MSTLLMEMTEEFLVLQNKIAKFSKADDQNTPPGEGQWEDVAELIYDRMATLARTIIATHARTPEELAQKARVALDWIDEDGDMSDMLVASLCRDVIASFEKH
jgi:hypothetical protein